MAQFSKLDTLLAIRSTGVVPVFYHPDAELVCRVAEACYQGGIRAFEFTNRGDGALRVFEHLVSFVRETCPDLAVGAGTILDAPTAALYIAAGADFIVSPALDGDTARLCNRRGVPYTPGCGTVTEITAALELGCDLIKIFPAGTLGGPAFVKNVLAPLPRVMLLATGAVEPAKENLSAWARSGVTAVGMGSKLFSAALLASADWPALTAACRDCLAWFSTR